MLHRQLVGPNIDAVSSFGSRNFMMAYLGIDGFLEALHGV